MNENIEYYDVKTAFSILQGIFNRASVIGMSNHKHYRHLSMQAHEMNDYLMINIATGDRRMLSDFAPEANIKGWAICTG
jgi:hypothetical protein